MVRMFVHHSVENYRTWRRAYDAFDAERKGLGVIGDDVYQAIDDPNDVTVYHDFKTRRRRKAATDSNPKRPLIPI